MNQLLDRGALVERDDATVSDHRADGAQFLEAELGVEQARRDDAGERAADDDALERAALQSAAELFDDIADRAAELDLVEAGTLEERIERDEFRSLALAESECAVGVRA